MCEKISVKNRRGKMNQKDPRVIRSRNALKAAMVRLLKAKQFSKIKISEICTAAGLNRSTFYSSYGNTEELLEDVYKDQCQKLEETVSLCPTYFECSKEERVTYIKSILEFYTQNMEITLVLLDSGEDNRYIRYSTNYFLERYGYNKADFLTAGYFLYHTMGGFSLIYAWLKAEKPCDIEELAQLIADMP